MGKEGRIPKAGTGRLVEAMIYALYCQDRTDEAIISRHRNVSKKWEKNDQFPRLYASSRGSSGFCIVSLSSYSVDSTHLDFGLC